MERKTYIPELESFQLSGLSFNKLYPVQAWVDVFLNIYLLLTSRPLSHPRTKNLQKASYVVSSIFLS